MPTTESRPPRLHGVRVLLVDDYASLRDVLQHVLEDCGAQVITAGSAEEALDLFARYRPDIVVTDLGLPNHDGYWLIRQIRQRRPEHGGQTPAILMTGSPPKLARTWARLAGFQALLVKPFEPDELCASIARLVAELL